MVEAAGIEPAPSTGQHALDFLPHLDPPVRMANLSPTTLTASEQSLILRATAGHLRDHLIVSLALGTGLRLGEIVGLNVGDSTARAACPNPASGCGERSRRAARHTSGRRPRQTPGAWSR